MLDKTDERVLSLDELNLHCEQWQRWLGLEDWQIDFQFVLQSSMPNMMAESTIYRLHKYSVISFPTPESYSSDVKPQQDMVSSLVHELIHLHLYPFFPKDKDSNEFIQGEQAINKLAAALVHLHDNLSPHPPVLMTEEEMDEEGKRDVTPMTREGMGP